jgi:hypothetical protein
VRHFPEKNADTAIAEFGMVLRKGGHAEIQMANKGDLRSIYTRTRRGYLDSGQFRVSYWSLASLRETFEYNIDPIAVTAEAFGGLGLLAEDQRWVSGESEIADPSFDAFHKRTESMKCSCGHVAFGFTKRLCSPAHLISITMFEGVRAKHCIFRRGSIV